MRIGIALGSNLGDRLKNLRTARARLQNFHRPEQGPFLCAPVYESEPVDCPPDSPGFLNTVMELDSDLDPVELFRRTRKIERAMGRRHRHLRNAPRLIDIDILYAGGLELRTPRLTLPHPAMTARGFVLVPLCRIRPDLVIPGQIESVAGLLKKLGTDRIESVRLMREDW